MRLVDLVATSRALTATRSRKAKIEALASALRAAGTDEVETATAYLSGVLRQRRTGLGWRSFGDLPAPAAEPTLTVAEVHQVFEEISAVTGTGSKQARADLVNLLFGRATADEQDYLRRLAVGELRQGALDGLVLEAIAVAADVPSEAVRRAAMLSGATLPVAAAALKGGAQALADFRLELGRPVRPMLASSAPDLPAAWERLADHQTVAVDCKLDGIRVQVHKYDGRVRIFTRTLEEITDRLPEIVEAVAALPSATLVVDGEAIALDESGRPRAFQDTAARTASRVDVTALRAEVPVTAYFFDVLHADGQDLLDSPASERFAALSWALPERLVVPRRLTDDPEEAATFFDEVVRLGHEGVVIKSLDAGYEAGRRGASWVKVKPHHALDLVVLAVEWGSGRRQGLLSNIHLGARDPEGGFVMLGKTFKGMTDEMLAWQTQRFTELAVSPETINDSYVVQVRPEQVVEVAFDGLQRSTRYPGGLALRFARVLRYRDDKEAQEADTIASVQALVHDG
jgi:DNA ligase-1